jgi:hypothetical protein
MVTGDPQMFERMKEIANMYGDDEISDKPATPAQTITASADLVGQLNRIQEQYDLRGSELLAIALGALAQRAPRQEALGGDFQRVLEENRWDLYRR